MSIEVSLSSPKIPWRVIDRPLSPKEMWRQELIALKSGKGTLGDRQKLLHRSAGTLDTTEIYTMGDPPPGSYKQYADDPSHWLPERHALHARILETHVRASHELAFQTAEPNTIYIVRGNTASGKSTILKKLGLFPDQAQANKAGIINPDLYKVHLLQEENKPGRTLVTHAQVHEESSMLARALLRETEEIPNGSVVIDKRFYGPDDAEEMLRVAKRTGKKLQFVDIEAPLEISLLRILTREMGGEDPRVPFAAVAEAYTGIRRYREHLIQQAMIDPSIASYDLFTVNDQGDSVLTATLAFDNNKRRIDLASPEQEQPFFKALLQDTDKTIHALGNQRITDAYIAYVLPGFRERQRQKICRALEKHRGKTLQEAVDAQAHELGYIA